MPTYSYHCPNCKREWERIKSIKDDSPEYCPECIEGGPYKMTRLISRGTGIVFRGAGWTPKFHSR